MKDGAPFVPAPGLGPARGVGWSAGAWFWLAQALATIWVFGSACSGRSLLAPVGLAPLLLSRFGFAGPPPDPPPNHYFYDQLVYDLPLQRLCHEAWRAGEAPWWNPYSEGGRPLLADAHVNGLDPIRLACTVAMPFVPAYNWTSILHFVLSGWGAWRLLRRFGIGVGVAVGFALAWEFAGCHSLKFGYPWLPAMFGWLPWIWLALDVAWESPGRRPLAAAGAATGAALLAGNLQSHAYVALFFAAWIAGSGGRSPAAWRRAIRLAAFAGVVGAAIAAPALAVEVELFAQNVRPVDLAPDAHGKPWFAPWLTLAGMAHPWLLGTFRTLDASKLGGVGLGSAGFNLFAGPLTLGAAVWSLTLGRPGGGEPRLRRAWTTSLWLVAAYFATIGTPLVNLLYTRSAGLGTLGLVVLAGAGLDRFRRLGRPAPRVARVACMVGFACAAAAALEAWVVWPRVRARVESQVTAIAARSPLGDAPELRAAQVARWPSEVSPLRPEATASLLGWVAAAFVALRPASRGASWRQAMALALNAAPLLIFAARCLPRADAAEWRRLEKGGPAQRRVADSVNPAGLRFWEPADDQRRRVFPGELAALWQVRALRGYSSLRPAHLAALPAPVREFWVQALGDPHLVGNRDSPVVTPGRIASRFRWIRDGGLIPSFSQRGLNRFRLEFPAPQSGDLLWTDTRYPGWTARADGQPVMLTASDPCFTVAHIGRPARVLDFSYRPTALPASLGISVAGLLAAAVTAVCPQSFRSGSPQSANPPPAGD